MAEVLETKWVSVADTAKLVRASLDAMWLGGDTNCFARRLRVACASHVLINGGLVRDSENYSDDY